MTKDINKFTTGRLSDYLIDCDICGAPCWHSESFKLDTYTGRGGCIVCHRCNDDIDYGLVPFVVPPERPVPVTRSNNFNDNVNIPTLYGPVTDYQAQDPLIITPQNPISIDRTWDGTPFTWDSYPYRWDE